MAGIERITSLLWFNRWSGAREAGSTTAYITTATRRMSEGRAQGGVLQGFKWRDRPSKALGEYL